MQHDTEPTIDIDVLGLDKSPGDSHYRAYVGPPYDYDLVAAMSFGLLTALGLRQHDTVLDIGCGSLRVGRLLIPYLNRGNYTGLEPNAWLVEDGIAREVGQDQVEIKEPLFVYADEASSLIAQQRRFDFMIAQSIFSHCGPDLIEQWVAQTANLLSERGVLVATFLEGTDNTIPGWIYPDCVTYGIDTLTSIARRHELELHVLDWKHPRQRWMLMAPAGFDSSIVQDGQLSWNAAFDRLNSRAQTV